MPEGCLGYIECELVEEIKNGDVTLVIGEALSAFADSEGFREHVLPQSQAGRTIHHLGGGKFGILKEE